jgi:hypothetical protein
MGILMGWISSKKGYSFVEATVRMEERRLGNSLLSSE